MNEIALNPNQLVQFLQKPAAEFTKADIIRYCKENGIQCINFRYCGWDGRLKTLNFVILSEAHLDTILSAGERVDGSSLFPFVEAGKSDLYVVPKFRTAFRNPFEETPTLDILCSFFNSEGQPFESSPEYILRKAHAVFKESTGYTFETMGELEYYVIDTATPDYLVADQRGYHESSPFCKFGDFRTEAMRLIAQAGCLIKYGHSEVGNFTQDGKIYEQNEIEFLPTDVEAAADQLVIAKWMMRTLAAEYGLTLTFAPKITVGKAGSGLHVHCKLSKDGRSCMVKDGQLTDAAKKAIAGLMIAGTSLPAFGNPNPLSFLRLVPHQEAPTSLCWSFSNRSALVRVPLGWIGKGRNMVVQNNPLEPEDDRDFSTKQTFEWRASDACADIYLLMAALCVAIRTGLETPDALAVAEKTYVGVNIHSEANKAIQAALEQLPDSCAAAATELEKDRAIYTAKGVFSEALVDYMAKFLRSFNDATLRADLGSDTAKIMALVNRHLHVG